MDIAPALTSSTDGDMYLRYPLSAISDFNNADACCCNHRYHAALSFLSGDRLDGITMCAGQLVCVRLESGESAGATEHSPRYLPPTRGTRLACGGGQGRGAAQVRQVHI